MAANEARLRATAKWQKANCKNFNIRFMPSTMDVYEHIQKQPNKTAYIVELVRNDMESGGEADGQE